MALSRQDQAYYEEKLGVKGFIPFFLATVVVGTIVFPLMLFFMDWSAGNTSTWSGKVVSSDMCIGFMLASIVAVVMNFIFRFLLWIGWLPARR